MTDSLKFHHIGVAVFSIEKTAKFYTDAGYVKTDTVFDPIQRVNICFLAKDGMPTVELLEPVDETSPVNDALRKNGVAPYHTCYEASDLTQTAVELRKKRIFPLGEAAKAVAFGGRKVQFFYNKNIGLIEIVEK